MPQSNGSKRECSLCREKFDLSEYVLHLLEEHSKWIKNLSERVESLDQKLELFFAYVEEDKLVELETPSSPPVLAKEGDKDKAESEFKDLLSQIAEDI